ncbi:nose resistant to fluoxetine protein 6-like [Topomyia yanbarensis]|uniref:nose resistant to fluoxetine protein 6-like n=1 Tax=Topomyia yanbarensis TaxID=2498891 RepID=UPI00273AF4D9|nr:nose resistant to fluoxetine protein 6-like [Topomyia yanbarensis]
MKKKIILLHIFFWWLVIDTGKCEIRNKSEYNKMPKVFQYDHYDDCLYGDPEREAAYCLVRVVIEPNNRSEVWKLIEKYSSNWKLDLNHAALDRGVCINNAEVVLAEFKDKNVSELIVPKFEIGFPYKIGNSAFRNIDVYQKNYSTLVDAKINKGLVENYGLRAYTEIEYCDRTNVDEFPIDNLDVAFLVILATLIVLMILSSWYDYSCKLNIGLDHYRENMPSKASMFLAAFSVIRNWYRLTSHSRDPVNRDLRFIQSVRYFTFVLILIGHACMLMQTRTAWFLEEKFRKPEIMIIVNGFQVVTTFFAISALVFTIMYIQKVRESGRKPGGLGTILIIIFRYIRLTPVYALVLLFEATWFVRLQDGPFWRRATETGLTYCRRNWWINLLYLNNYFTLDQPCMQHSWYLACDFQLSIVGVILVTLILRLPKLKLSVLTGALTITFAIPVAVIYLNGFDGVSIFSPEGRRLLFWYDVGYHKTYLPTHMHLNMCVVGVVLGFLYWKVKNSNYNLRSKRIFRIVWYLLFLLWPTLFLSGQHFYINDYPKPSVWMSIYFTVARSLWALLLCIGFFGFIYRVNKPLTRLLSIRLFEVLGRLTYGAYVVHFFIMKIMFYNVRHLDDFDAFDTSVRINATLYLSYVLSLALTLLVELPVSAIQKLLIQSIMKPTKQHNREDGNAGQTDEDQHSKGNGRINGGYVLEATFKGLPEFQQQS